MEKNVKKDKSKKSDKNFINKKIAIALLLILVILVMIILSVFLKKDNINKDNVTEKYVENIDGVKVNTSETLASEKKFMGLRIFDISFTNQDGVTSFTANLENQGAEDFKAKDVEIIFKNEDGSEYTRITGYIVDIPSGAMDMISASIVEDKLNAYDFEIVEKKE